MERFRLFRVAAAVGVLTASFATGSLLASSESVHAEVFSYYDLRLCETVTVYAWSITTGDESQRYLDAFLKLSPIAGDEGERFTERAKMLKAGVPDEQVKAIADRCIVSFSSGQAFVNPFPAQSDERAFNRWLAAIAPASAPAGQESYAAGPEVQDPGQAAKISQCNGIIDRATASATKDFRSAQRGVETWIKTGVRYGFDYVQYGCTTIDSALNQLREQQCPAEFEDALRDFRNNYYIGLPGGSRLECR